MFWLFPHYLFASGYLINYLPISESFFYYWKLLRSKLGPDSEMQLWVRYSQKIRRGLHNCANNCDKTDESSLMSIMGQGSRRAALAHPASAKPVAFSFCRVVLKPHLKARCDFQSLYKISMGNLVARCCCQVRGGTEASGPFAGGKVLCLDTNLLWLAGDGRR